MTWHGFVRLILATVLLAGGGVFAVILLIDPFDTLAFSPPLDRAPTTDNQRFSYPAIARDDDFDSAVIGTSTVRLLRPEELEEAFGGRFANLAMNSATAYEQQRILDVFLRNREQPKTVLIGIDAIWCDTREQPRLTPRPFPEWMYDDDPWNDILPHFNAWTVEQAVRQTAQILDLRDADYALNGYENFLPPRSEYDLAKAQGYIYGGAEPAIEKPVSNPPDRSNYRKRLTFPSHGRLAKMIGAIPEDTRVIALTVPYHAFRQATPGTADHVRWQECKDRILNMLAGRDRAHFVDFMIRSEITTNDSNYWDPLHYDPSVATKVVDLMARAVRRGDDIPGMLRYLDGADQKLSSRKD